MDTKRQQQQKNTTRQMWCRTIDKEHSKHNMHITEIKPTKKEGNILQ